MKKPMILGAICGDVIGSTYEFRSTKDYNFPMFLPRAAFTDDTVMTIAVADWILNAPTLSEDILIKTMKYYGNKYPAAGYGGTFRSWLIAHDSKPYNSWGNGSAMRVSACGFAFDTEEEVMRSAEISAAVTHNHPEGIKGAQATAMAVFLARKGASKDEIKQYVEQKFGYDLSRAYKDIQPTYRFEISCQETVPQSIICFLESNNYEDCIRKAIAMGGDADTMGAIAGAIAAAYYDEIPDEIIEFVNEKLDENIKSVLNKFLTKFNSTEGAEHNDESQTNSLKQATIAARPKYDYTPKHISSLAENEVFVFGSNLNGYHGGGAAAAAMRYFGAIWGQGIGLQGQSYAIPTMQGGVKTIQPYVDDFIAFAKSHPELVFLVTRIGCGIAGFRDEEMAPLFADAIGVDNIVLPKSFISELT